METIQITDLKYCSRCIYNETTAGIVFDDDGVCNYCHLYDEMDQEYPTGDEGRRILEAMAAEIKAAGRGKKFDCVVGVSGGCDSSWLLIKAKELGLRPLAVHFDNTWNSTIATENIHNLLRKLDVELFTIVVDNQEYNDMYRAFFQAGVPDLDSCTDIGLAATLYKACEKFGIKYIIEGHSFRTEGVSPLGWCYMDGKYIASVHDQFGTMKRQTYPNMPLYSFLKWTAFSGIRKVRPLYYMDYNKEEAKRILAEKYDWQWYGGHHLENRFTAFCHSYFFPVRWGIDQRANGYAALVRCGQMSRDEAMRLMAEPPHLDPEILTLVKKRLGFSDAEFDRLMNLPRKTYKDYPTYKPTFERLRPLFWMLYKANRVPKSFYVKYTAKA